MEENGLEASRRRKEDPPGPVVAGRGGWEEDCRGSSDLMGDARRPQSRKLRTLRNEVEGAGVSLMTKGQMEGFQGLGGTRGVNRIGVMPRGD